MKVNAGVILNIPVVMLENSNVGKADLVKFSHNLEYVDLTFMRDRRAGIVIVLDAEGLIYLRNNLCCTESIKCSVPCLLRVSFLFATAPCLVCLAEV